MPIKSLRIDLPDQVAAELQNLVSAGWFISQDELVRLAISAAARLFAKSFQLEVRGSLGVILWAAATGKLSQIDAEALLNNFVCSSLWLSPRVISEARLALTQIYT